MDDWKLKARAVVKLRRESNMFVSSYPVYFRAVERLIILIALIARLIILSTVLGSDRRSEAIKK